MKIVNLLLTFLFALFALAQYNDSDGWSWIIVYLFVAVTSFFAFRGDYNRGVLLLAMFLILGWLVMLVPDVKNWIEDGGPSLIDEMKASSPYIELVREFFGLLLSFLVLVLHYFQSRKFD